MLLKEKKMVELNRRTFLSGSLKVVQNRHDTQVKMTF